MATISEAAAAPATEANGLQVRLLYRDSQGQLTRESTLEQIPQFLTDPDGMLWLDITHPTGETKTVEALFHDVFHFHPLAIEDALREANMPKVDDWETYLYLVFHAISFDSRTDEICLHEVDIFLGKNYLVTFHSEPISSIDRLCKLLERDPQHQMSQGPDHVLYHLLDMIVDEHLAAIEHLDETIDAAEEEILEKATPRTLSKILRVKKSALRLHRVIGPQREVVNRLVRDPYDQIDVKDRIYFRNVYDQLIRLHDITETVRDLVGGALETYLSVTANKTNDVMKTLTVVTVLFLPLNFFVGFFGMNFFGDNIHLDNVNIWHALILVTTCLAMLCSPILIWRWAKHWGWF